MRVDNIFGNSGAIAEESVPGPNGETVTAWHLTGEKNGNQSLALASPPIGGFPANIEAQDGIQFWAKLGSADAISDWKVVIHDVNSWRSVCSQSCSPQGEQDLGVITQDWQKFEVRFDDLHRSGPPLDLSQVYKIYISPVVEGTEDILFANYNFIRCD